MESTVDQWNVDCSDEENYGLTYSKMCKQWVPSPTTTFQLFENFSANENNFLSLEWVCPGRKELPTGESENGPENEQLKTEEKSQSDFDFWDEPNNAKSANSTVNKRIVGPGSLIHKQPRGSAKKKTTSLDGILSSMRRHRKLDQQLAKPSPPKNPQSTS